MSIHPDGQSCPISVRVFVCNDPAGSRELKLNDIVRVRKLNKVGAISAVQLTRRADGKSFLFASIIFREAAFRCIHDAWLTVANPREDKSITALEDRDKFCLPHISIFKHSCIGLIAIL